MTQPDTIGEGWQDAVSEIDVWAKKRAERLTTLAAVHVRTGGNLNDPIYRTHLGEHRAYMALRSFIHGLRAPYPGRGLPNPPGPHSGASEGEVA